MVHYGLQVFAYVWSWLIFVCKSRRNHSSPIDPSWVVLFWQVSMFGGAAGSFGCQVFPRVKFRSVIRFLGQKPVVKVRRKKNMLNRWRRVAKTKKRTNTVPTKNRPAWLICICKGIYYPLTIGTIQFWKPIPDGMGLFVGFFFWQDNFITPWDRVA